MRSLIAVATAGILILGFGACGGNQEDKLRADARALYERTVKLNRAYSDSIVQARDSATLDRLDAAYEAALEKLNFGFPAETDYGISEGENDTLRSLSARYVFLRDSMLSVVGNNAHLAADTVEVEQEAVRPGGKP